MSGCLRSEPTGSREANQLRQPPHLGARDGSSKGRDAVVATTFVVINGPTPGCDFGNQALLYHAGDRAIQGSGAHSKLAFGSRLDVLDYRVAMAFAVQDGQQDVEGG